MDKTAQRLRRAESVLRSMQMMEAFDGRVVVTKQNVNLPTKIEREFDDGSPLEIVISSISWQDDDLRVRVGGVTVFDPKLNVVWYNGEQDLGPGGNPGYGTSGFRVARIKKSEALALGAPWKIGVKVSVDVFDGWGNAYKMSPWTVAIYWPNGIITRKSGGRSFSGTSATSAPSPLPSDYYSTGPHFADYYPNGSFLLN